ncbi:MAG: hypothetical protein JSV66_16480 [Trueperaceae bacterium]|nr:MAG: hypothetical protein JSV66_16480 [Trueperaceae bacterium]
MSSLRHWRNFPEGAIPPNRISPSASGTPCGHTSRRAPDLPYADYKIVISLALFSHQRDGDGQRVLTRRLEAYFRDQDPDAPVMQGLASVNWREIATTLIGVIHQVDWSDRDGAGADEAGLW